MINSSPAATAVAEIEDLLTNILLRLPSKSLIKFKCVCRQWLSLISSTEFGISHTRFRRSNSTPTALLLSYNPLLRRPKGLKYLQIVVPLNLSTREESLPSFDFMEDKELQILRSCNGLLLCHSMQNPSDSNCIIDELVICNPTTRQSRRLSCPGSLRERYRINRSMSVCLAYDPNISPHYKFISILEPRKQNDRCAVEFHVYSSENDSWTSQIADATDLRSEFSDPAYFGTLCAFCNGCIHWIMYGSPRVLLCLLLDALTFKELSLPDELRNLYFGESQGHLNVIGCKDDYNCYVLEIAVDYSGWSVKYHVNLQSLKLTLSGRYYTILSCFHAENDELVIVLRMDGAIVRYNLPDGTFKKIYDLVARPENRDQPIDSCYKSIPDGFLFLHYSFEDSYQYFESLVCV